MARVRMQDPIRTLDGAISTIAAEADAGRITFRMVERFQGSPNGPVRVAYFADLSEDSGFEIGVKAWESRTGHGCDRRREGCAQCGETVDPLAVFPGGLCLACWEPIGNAEASTMTAEKLAEMWGGKAR